MSDYFEKVFVIEPVLNSSDKIEYSINEIYELIKSANGTPLGHEIVKIREITPATYIGKGKILEIYDKIALLEVDTVLFDGALSPSQTLNLSDALGGIKVIDRTTLILDIFAQNAKTNEGKIQVELAQLNYLYPRLKGKGGALSKLGGGIGTRGPGETQLETDRRHIRERIDNLKKEIEELKIRRENQSYRRNKNSEITVCLVGYTNAGKSTLLNKLTGANVLCKDQLFATLDPTVKKCKINGYEVLLIDTVGFIKNIPTDLVAAFESTLEVVKTADLNLIVLDGTNDYDEHLKVTEETLLKLGATAPTIKVINKCDNIENFELLPKNTVKISAKSGLGIENLKNSIENVLNDNYITTNLYIPYTEFKNFNKNTSFLDSYTLEYKNEYILANVTVKKIYFDRFIKYKKI